MRTTLIVTLVAIVAAMQPAHADASDGNGGAVLVRGGKEEQRALALAAATDVVRRNGWLVGERIYSGAELTAATECVRKVPAAPWPCLTGVLRDKRIQQLAIITVDEQAGKNGGIDTRIVQRLVFAKTDTLWIAERYCSQCTSDRFGKLARELTEDLVGRAIADRGQTVIAIQATPPGARLYIDSEIVGITTASVGVSPGPHVVTAELEKYESVTRNVRVAPDTTEPVTITLKPRDGAANAPAGPDPRQNQTRGATPETPSSSSLNRPQIVGLALVGVGAAALITGGIWVAIDQDDATEPGEEVSRRFRNSGPRGVAVGLSGVAVAGVGAYLWWHYRPKSRISPAPTLNPTSGGATIGITGSF